MVCGATFQRGYYPKRDVMLCGVVWEVQVGKQRARPCWWHRAGTGTTEAYGAADARVRVWVLGDFGVHRAAWCAWQVIASAATQP
jgi:hypothetical protein